MPGRRIIVPQQIRYGRIAPLKDDESRVIPIQKVLVPILTAWRLKSGGQGLLFKPARPCGFCVRAIDMVPGDAAYVCKPLGAWRWLDRESRKCVE